MKPLTIIDVGASGGTLPAWKNENIKIIGFEPDERSFEELNKTKKSIYFNTGLWSSAGICDMYLTRSKTDSSLLKPNSKIIDLYTNPERFDVIGTSKIKVDTLDNLVENADFVKLDTQGSELEILKGGEKLLKILSGVEIEVEFIEIYENQPLFWSVDQFLRKFDFHLMFLKPHFWKLKNGLKELTYADTLYIKSNGPNVSYIAGLYQKYYNPQPPPIFSRVLHRLRKGSGL